MCVEKRQLAGIGRETETRGTQLKKRGTERAYSSKGNILYIGKPCLCFDQQFARLKKKEKKAEAWS